MEQAVPITTTIDPPSASEISEQLRSLAGQRVAVAMSGGVDSAVAAFLLKEAGAEVVGLSLRLHDPNPENPLAPRACCPPDDLQDARRVAELLNMPFYVIDGRESFSSAVVKPFVNAYLRGRTPNPCVGCNSFVKLRRLAQRAKALGASRLITGHYARVRPLGPGRTALYRGHDRTKDQSYFLFGTAPDILEKLVFPLGAMSKDQVRELALSSGLPVAHKLDSQEVCFVGGAGAGRFVMQQPEAQGDHAGPITTPSGEEIGQHQGIMNFTIGQRKGIGLARGSKLHVLNIVPEQKTIVVGEEAELYKKGLRAGQASWPKGVPPGPLTATVKVRYRDPGTEAMVSPQPDGGVRVHFKAPVRAIAPGQAAVFYQGDEVVGGAWIEEASGE